MSTTTHPKPVGNDYPIYTAHFIGGCYDGGDKEIDAPSVRYIIGSTAYRFIARTVDGKDLYYADESQLKPRDHESG